MLMKINVTNTIKVMKKPVAVAELPHPFGKPPDS
jgi:hypothetical protein